MDDKVNTEALDYRLSNIEKTLSELKDVVVENKIQARDIEELKIKTGEFVNAINSHDQRIRVLEMRPYKEKATMWTSIVDTVVKLIISAGVVAVLAKIGLKA